MFQKKIIFTLIFAISTAVTLYFHDQKPQAGLCESGVFWDTIPDKQVSYFYAPGLITTEFVMGRYCPEFTAMTGEKIFCKNGGHVIGQPHSAVAFSDTNLKKPSCFTLNPITFFTNKIRQDLFPLAERYFKEKYGITVVDNPHSKLTVINYTPKLSAANIGQQKDINTFHKAYKKHSTMYPDMDIVLYGDSRGAATIFNVIALYNPEKVKAAVLEGIFDTVPHCIKHFLYDDKNPETDERLHHMLSMMMWKYKKNGINPRQSAEIIGDRTYA